MVILKSKNSEVNEEMDAYKMAATFPRLKQDFAAIQELREMYRRLDVEARMNKRSHGGLGRRVAVLPPPVFTWLTIRFPEVLRNKQLLRAFLKANPQYCLVQKL